MSDAPNAKRWIILFAVIAVPGALGIETLLRWLVLPDEFEEVRTFFAPVMTTAAWVLLGLTALCALLGMMLQRWLTKRARSKAERAGNQETAGRAGIGAFLLAASVPQAPALIAVFTYLLGAALLPVIVAVALSTVGVCLQAAKVK